MNTPSLLQTERKLIIIFLTGSFLFLLFFEGFFLLSRFFFEEKISRTGFGAEIQRIENRERETGKRGREMGPRIGMTVFSVDKSGAIRNERGPGIPLLDEEIISLEYLSDIDTGVITKKDDILIYKKLEPEELGGYQVFIRKSGYPLEDLLRDILRFLILDILIIIPFYFMGRFFVRKTLEPVEENIEAMSHFIHDAGHELKTPLAIISGNLQIMRDTNNTNRDLIEESIYTIHAMSDSLDGLLELSNIKKSQNPAPIAVFEAFSIELKKEKNEIAKKNLSIELKIPKEYTLPIDAKHFSLLFGNLIRNAIIYNTPDGSISIEAFEDTIRITDTGIGIDEKNIKKIWERFYREEKSGKNPGTGIGLSIVEKIIHLYGWKIEITSKKGEGTSVVVRTK